MAKLSGGARKKLPSSDFAEPGKRKYPIEDKSHARNALSRSSGKPEAKQVRAAVKKKYPDIGKGKKSR